jgi:hypothetical protein
MYGKTVHIHIFNNEGGNGMKSKGGNGITITFDYKKSVGL